MPTRFRYSVALLLDVLVLFRLNLACASRDPLSYGYSHGISPAWEEAARAAHAARNAYCRFRYLDFRLRPRLGQPALTPVSRLKPHDNSLAALCETRFNDTALITARSYCRGRDRRHEQHGEAQPSYLGGMALGHGKARLGMRTLMALVGELGGHSAQALGGVSHLTLCMLLERP